MCYAIPGKVIEIQEKTAVVSYFGETKKAISELSNLKVGDYIYAQGGFAIKIIPEKEALEILATWKETFFDLQETDLRLSRMDLEKKRIDRKAGLIFDKVLEGGKVTDSDLPYFYKFWRGGSGRVTKIV